MCVHVCMPMHAPLCVQVHMCVERRIRVTLRGCGSVWELGTGVLPRLPGSWKPLELLQSGSLGMSLLGYIEPHPTLCHYSLGSLSTIYLTLQTHYHLSSFLEESSHQNSSCFVPDNCIVFPNTHAQKRKVLPGSDLAAQRYL